MSKQFSLKHIAVVALTVSTLTGCGQFNNKILNQTQSTDGSVSTNSGMVESDSIQIAREGVALIHEGDFVGASALFNSALKINITNSSLQLLNGLAYHLIALKGDVTYFPLAEQGYKLAIQYDNTNWLAYYYAGLLRMDQRDFKGAQEYFSEALLFKDNDPDVLYSMSVSSYYAQDPESAAGVLEKLRDVKPGSPKALQASAIVMAALGNAEDAKKYLNEYEDITGDVKKGADIEERLASWERVHERARLIETNAKAVSVQAIDAAKAPSQTNQTASQTQTSPKKQDNEGNTPPDWFEGLNDEESNDLPIDEHKMVIVDVVIIRTEEDITTSKGVNLLSGLNLQFGLNPDGLTPGFGTQSESIKVSESEERTKTITRSINIPSIKYSLNIANSASGRNEILARPTLVALSGEVSEFFSGVEILAAAVGGSGGDGSTVEVEKEIGVKLKIMPEFLNDGRVKLNVVAERTFLTTPNTNSVTFTLRIDTSKTTVSANVAMNYGETLILSGLIEKETERKRDGVPLLQDIPGLQYFFSKRTTRDFQKSVLILMTPRPPSYTYQSDGQLKKTTKNQSKSERSLSELQARYTDWFKPYPNWASVFHHMQNNTLYREFRTGDVTMERWANSETLKSRLKQAMTFLYY